jgi:hypothetical protein
MDRAGSLVRETVVRTWRRWTNGSVTSTPKLPEPTSGVARLAKVAAMERHGRGRGGRDLRSRGLPGPQRLMNREALYKTDLAPAATRENGATPFMSRAGPQKPVGPAGVLVRFPSQARFCREGVPGACRR